MHFRSTDFSCALIHFSYFLRSLLIAQREARITERQNKREIAKEAWMLNHQKRKNQQNAGSASKSRVSASESNQDKAAEDDMSSNARACPFVFVQSVDGMPSLHLATSLCLDRPMEWQRQTQPRQKEATAGLGLIYGFLIPLHTDNCIL